MNKIIFYFIIYSMLFYELTFCSRGIIDLINIHASARKLIDMIRIFGGATTGEKISLNALIVETATRIILEAETPKYIENNQFVKEKFEEIQNAYKNIEPLSKEFKEQRRLILEKYVRIIEKHLNALEEKRIKVKYDHTKSDSLLNELANLKEDIHLYRDDSLSLWLILRGIFKGSWFEARKYLTIDYKWLNSLKDLVNPPTTDYCLDLMNELVKMRTKRWDEFTEFLKPMVEAKVKTVLKTINSDLIQIFDNQVKQIEFFYGKQLEREIKADKLYRLLLAAGSNSVTSDVDIPMDGSNSEIVVSVINEQFKTFFKIHYDCGMVFDINVYAMDWLHGYEPSDLIGDIVIVSPQYEYKDLKREGSAVALSYWNNNNLMWALVKLIRNLSTKDEYETFRDKSLDGLYEKLEEMKEIFLNAKRETENMIKKINDEIKNLKGYDDTDSNDKYGAQLVASNNLYVKYLLEVKETRLSIATYVKPGAAIQITRFFNFITSPSQGNIPKDPSFYVPVLAYKIAESLTYANEVYASEGATLFTVLGQKKKEILEKLKAQYGNRYKDAKEVKFKFNNYVLTESVIENAGDALHSLHFYKEYPAYAVYRSGKYLLRMIQSVIDIFEYNQDTYSKSDYNKQFGDLLAIGITSSKAKQLKTKLAHKDDKNSEIELEGVPITILNYKEENQEFFKFRGTVDKIKQLEKDIINYAGTVFNNILKSKKLNNI